MSDRTEIIGVQVQWAFDDAAGGITEYFSYEGYDFPVNPPGKIRTDPGIRRLAQKLYNERYYGKQDPAVREARREASRVRYRERTDPAILKEQRRKACSRWRKKHPEKHRAQQARHRARRKA